MLITLIISSSLTIQHSTASSTPPACPRRPDFPKEALPTKSGYLPISPNSTSAIFYTYYKAQQSPISPQPKPTPILIWLQGGPGCSSMLGNFFELGPYLVSECNPDSKNQTRVVLKPNPGSWNRIFDLLFFDNPIGSGFSIASDPGEIPKNQNTVAKHLYAALTGFLALDPDFRTRPVYITGESYAGKFIPSIGYHILKRNEELPVSKRVNLAGIAIGNGMTDPVIQVTTHADTAYYLGLINERQRNEVEKVQTKAVKLVEAKKWRQAARARNRVLRLVKNLTGLATDFDFTRKRPYKTGLVTRFLRSKDVKRKLGARESIEFVGCNRTIRSGFRGEVMKSVKRKVEVLVKKVGKVLLYQGSYDLRDSVASSEAWIKTMKWDGIERFLVAERKVWRVLGNGDLAGYVQSYGGLSHVVVLGAGHMVQADQGVNSQAMIEDWVLERGLFGGEEEEEGKELLSSELKKSM
ncbi:unnamed protein product [Linum tenue]|uniref:Carboxypeptidase n=1 Tax=Linum tenue TaxID=586396 RepID=A0AAV0GY03_9ROSI|nr:unnamed protein product [Linum tenue]